MSLNNFLCTPFVEVLTFAILWIGILIEPEPVEIWRIKRYIINSTLNVAVLYFEDPGLLTSVEKFSEQYLHLLKTEYCRL